MKTRYLNANVVLGEVKIYYPFPVPSLLWLTEVNADDACKYEKNVLIVYLESEPQSKIYLHIL